MAHPPRTNAGRRRRAIPLLLAALVSGCEAPGPLRPRPDPMRTMPRVEERHVAIQTSIPGHEILVDGAPYGQSPVTIVFQLRHEAREVWRAAGRDTVIEWTDRAWRPDEGPDPGRAHWLTRVRTLVVRDAAGGEARFPFILAEPDEAVALGADPDLAWQRAIPRPVTIPAGRPVLTIESRPVGALVLVNGVRRGYAPLELTLPQGRYVLEVRLEGYEALQREVVVGPGTIPGLVADLERGVIEEGP